MSDKKFKNRGDILAGIFEWAWDAGMDVKIQSRRHIREYEFGRTEEKDMPVLTFSKHGRQVSIQALNFFELFERIQYDHKRIAVELCVPELKLGALK